MALSQISLIVSGLIFVLLGLCIRLALRLLSYRHVYAYDAAARRWTRLAVPGF
jgi:hypothetical protein